jgi:hypothetical protein
VKFALYLILILALILFPIFPQTRPETDSHTDMRVEWTPPRSLPHMPQHHEWHDPLYSIQQTLSWIATSGSHEMQKYPLEVVYAAQVTVSMTAQQYATSNGNGRKLFYDAYGKYIVVYRSSTQIRVAYSNTSPPSSWTDAALSNPTGVQSSESTGVAATYSSASDALMVAWPTTTTMKVEQVTFTRDANHNITGITEGSVLSITPTVTGATAPSIDVAANAKTCTSSPCATANLSYAANDLVMAYWTQNGGTAPTSTGVTLGGTQMTFLGSAGSTTNGDYTAIYYLYSTSAANVAISATWTPGNSAVLIGVAWKGAASSNSFEGLTTNEDATGNTASATVTVAASNNSGRSVTYFAGQAGAAGYSAAYKSVTACTIDKNGKIGSAANSVAGADAYDANNDGSADTCTITFNGNGKWSMIGVAILAASRTTASPFNPSLWTLHNNEVALVFGADTTDTNVNGAVQFCRLAFGSPPTYKNAAGTSSTLDVISSRYMIENTIHYPTIVERVNSGTGQYDLYAFWMAKGATLLDITSKQAKATWSSPNWSWAAEATSTAAINGPPTANYDSTNGLIVYASAYITITDTAVNVGTVNASDTGTDISKTGLPSDTRSSPSLAIKGGNYYVFYELTSNSNLYYVLRSGGSWGSETSFNAGANEAYPSTKVDDAGGNIDVVWTHYTGSSYYVYYDKIVVGQQITLTASGGSALARVGALTLNTGENSLYTGVLDVGNGYAYFGTSTSPGIVVRVRLSDFTRVGALTLNTGENSLYTSVIDAANGYAYFGTYTSPGRVVKIRLSDFTRVGALTLNTGENYLHSAVLDAGNGYAYFGTDTSPGIVVKVRLSDFTRVGALTLNTGEGSLQSAVLDVGNGYAYFGTYTSPGIVVKVRLSDFTRVGALTLNTGENSVDAGVLDVGNGYAYFGTFTVPGIVVKVRLSDFTRIGAITLNTGEDSINDGVIDAANGYAYFGTYTSPGRVVKIRLSDFTRVGAITLNTGEGYLAAAVFDAGNGYAYFGSEATTPGAVVKVRLFNSLTGSGYVTVDGSAVSTPYTVAWRSGDTHTIAVVSPVSCGAGCQYEWNRWSDGGAQSHSITVSPSTTTYTAVFGEEWGMTLSYAVSGGGSPTAPTLSYTKNGASQTPALTISATVYWMDDTTTWSVTPNPLTGSGSSERWQSNQALSGTATGASTAVFNFYHQYLLTFSWSWAYGGSPSSPTLTATQFGGSYTPTMSGGSTGYWTDGGQSWSVTNPLSPSNSTRQWWTNQQTTGTVSSSFTINYQYYQQFMLTMQVSPSGSGTTTPSTGWRNATSVTITANPGNSYLFSSWTCTGTGCYAGTSNPGSVTLSAAMTETANFIPNQVSVTGRVISSTNCGTSCGAGNNITGSPPAINVNTEYWFSTTIGDTGGLTDVDSVVIYIYKTGVTKTTFDQQRAYGFRWVRQGWSGSPSCSTSGGCWQELTGTGTWSATLTYLISADSSHSTLGAATTGTWTFAAQLNKLAQFTSTNMDWNYEVDIQNIASTSSASRSGVLDVNLYVSITVPSSVNLGTLSGGATNSSAGNYPATYTGNAILVFQIYGPGDPANQYGDTFPLSNIYVGQTGTPSNNDGRKLAYSSQNLYSSLPVAASQNENMYWFTTTPNPFPPGTYSFSYVINIDIQTWAT